MANTKPIDKTNPKNIYCDHCAHWHRDYGPYGYDQSKCKCTCPASKHFGKQRNYWNRCKQFAWK